MKVCLECGESNRDDAKQCVCGRPFGFELPHGLNRSEGWNNTVGTAGPVTENSQTVFGVAPQAKPNIVVLYRYQRWSISSMLAVTAAIIVLCTLIYTIHSAEEREWQEEDRSEAASRMEMPEPPALILTRDSSSPQIPKTYQSQRPQPNLRGYAGISSNGGISSGIHGFGYGRYSSGQLSSPASPTEGASGVPVLPVYTGGQPIVQPQRSWGGNFSGPGPSNGLTTGAIRSR